MFRKIYEKLFKVESAAEREARELREFQETQAYLAEVSNIHKQLDFYESLRSKRSTAPPPPPSSRD